MVNSIFILMYFIVFFYFFCISLFFRLLFCIVFSMKMSQTVFQPLLGQNQLIKVIKEKIIMHLELYDKTLLSIGNVHKITNLANFRLTCIPEKGRGFVTYARLPQIWSQKMRKTSKKKVMKWLGEVYSRCGLIARNV